MKKYIIKKSQVSPSLLQNIGTMNVDSSDIDSAYQGSKIAVELVREYDASLLKNIIAITTSSGNEYGLFNTGETFFDPQGGIESVQLNSSHPLNNLPSIISLQDSENMNQIVQWMNAAQADPSMAGQYQDIKNNIINNAQKGYIIHVNVNKILSEKNTDIEAVLEVAATIVHEARHVMDTDQNGQTSESSAENAETAFVNWAMGRVETIYGKYPDLRPEMQVDSTNM